MSFEEAFSQLEATVARLESGNLTLEEAVAFYEEGMRLAQLCGQRLDAAELRVSRLTTGDNGQVTEVRLDPNRLETARTASLEETE